MSEQPSPRPIDWQVALARHHRWLKTVIYARLRDVHEADEVLQEVALAAVAQTAPLKDPDKLAPWLYRLAVRQVLLYRRRLGRQRRLGDAYARRQRERTLPQDAADPLDWLLADERQSQVRQALEQMGRRDAEILLLKYTEQWSYREIAEHLGIAETAVQARLHRARQRLRRQLAAWNLVEVRP